jgi:hypothetical protein
MSNEEADEKTKEEKAIEAKELQINKVILFYYAIIILVNYCGILNIEYLLKIKLIKIHIFIFFKRKHMWTG